MQQADFVYHLYELFQDFIQSPPNIVDVKDSGKFKSCSNIWVGTLAFACFNFYRELFYIYQADLVSHYLCYYYHLPLFRLEY